LTVNVLDYPAILIQMITIGLSGYDYEDWRGVFYPEKLTRREWLGYYSNHFKALELNFSYYRMPSPGQLESMVERTGGRVTFAIKAHRSMTHDRTASDLEYNAFLEAVGELRQADRLASVLAQFPNSFRQNQDNRRYLKRLADRLGPPLTVEFRHADWATEPVIDWLGRLGIGFTCVDEPDIKGLLPARAVATANPAYVRFHGRNRAKWYEHDQPAERYDYRYSKGELSGWTEKIRAMEKTVDQVLVFFNNHFQGKAVESARLLERLLLERPGG
jgi:uncharacterized protein YecE (DUF72 family)